MGDWTPPSSLRTYLDQGGDLVALGNPFVAQLAELVVADRRLFGFEQVARRERAADRDSEERKSERAAFWAEAEARDPSWAQQRRDEDIMRGWVAELIADEAFCDRVEGALPRDVVEEHLEDVEVERGAKFQAFVEQRQAFTCDITGDVRSGPALVLVGRGFVGRELASAGFDELVVSVATLRELLGEQ